MGSPRSGREGSPLAPRRSRAARDERGETAAECRRPLAGPGRHSSTAGIAGDVDRDSGEYEFAGRRGRRPPFAAQEFVREVAIRLGALRFGSVQGDRQAVAGGLGQAHAARDDGLVDRRAEVAADFRGDFRRQVRPSVEHREEDSLDRELGVQVIPNEIDGGGELAEPLEGVVLALDRDQHRVGCGERVDREQAERRRAVDEHVVVVVADVVERRREAALAGHQRCQLDLGSGQRERGRDEVKARRPASRR